MKLLPPSAPALLLALGAILSLLACSNAARAAVELTSPDGRLSVTFSLAERDGRRQAPLYAVSWKGQPVLAPSGLGLDIDGAPLLADFRIVGTETAAQDTTWAPVLGEYATVRDHYRQVIIRLEQTTDARRQLQLTFRAYDAGVAFCYTIPEQAGLGPIKINREHSEFRFHGDHAAWAVYSAQGVYQKVTLSQIKSGCERPLPIELRPDVYVALAEARLIDYARMKFGPLAGAAHSLRSELGSPVQSSLPLATPWRVVMVAESAGGLLAHNTLLLNLNPPCALADTSWIKPGKVLREVTLTTVGGKACVDFAAQHNLQYILFDAGWYGHEYDNAADATGVNVDPKRSKGPLDLPEVIRYATAKNVGVILYVNQRALTKQLDVILPLYRSWGVKGVKYGFVHVGTQAHTAWLHEAIRKAAEHHLMLDIHDEYRPTGNQRTYPNLMTVEGIAGDETSPLNSTTLTHLFSRLIAGPADNTICYYDARVDRLASHAYQLAKAVVLFSPWTHLYWYDRPAGAPARVGGAGGAETGIGHEPELKFYDAVPTTWDDTRILHGRIGEYAVIARRKGVDWFIGAMNSGEPRTLPIALDFLPHGRPYTAEIFFDDPAVKTRTKVGIAQRAVDSTTVLDCALSAQGGQAMRLTPR